MIVTVNGELKELREETVSIINLLIACKVEMPEMVSVQLNGNFVDKADFASTFVKSGDTIDFLYFMGGGSK